jgi:3'-5' exoribonuclease
MKQTRTLWVKDLQPGQTVEEVFMVQALKEGLAKNNKPYLTITIADKTGTIDVKDWGGTLAAFPFRVGSFVNMTLSTEEYNGKIQGKLLGAQNAPTAQNSQDFVKASQYDPDVMWADFEKFLTGFHHQHFKDVAGDLFDPPSRALFQVAPAATGMHHAFKHGLLEHTLQMLQIGEKVLDFPFFENLNHDLCMFGLMFHDFGKIYEYSTDPGYKKRLQGILVPHIPMVAARILESANKFCVPEMVRDHMMHVVLAHHRFLEWGSPVKFACPEAAFIHHIDNLHGDVFGILQKRAEATEDTVKHGFYDDTVTVLKKPFSSILEETKGVEGGF